MLPSFPAGFELTCPPASDPLLLESQALQYDLGLMICIFSPLTFTAWSRPSPERWVGTPKTKMREKARALSPSSRHPFSPLQPKASGSLTAPQRWARGGVLSAGPSSTLRASRCHGNSGVARATASRGPAIHHSSGARGWGGSREGLSRAPVLVTGLSRRSGDRWARGMEASCLLGTTENIVSMPTAYVHLTSSSVLAWGH